MEVDVELAVVFARVSTLTGQYPDLTKAELVELRGLTRNLSVDCGELLLDYLAE